MGNGLIIYFNFCKKLPVSIMLVAGVFDFYITIEKADFIS